MTIEEIKTFYKAFAESRQGRTELPEVSKSELVEMANALKNGEILTVYLPRGGRS